MKITIYLEPLPPVERKGFDPRELLVPFLESIKDIYVASLGPDPYAEDPVEDPAATGVAA